MREYKVMIAGVEHTMLLDDEHAKRLGAEPVTASKPVANKARQTRSKADE